MGAVTSKVRLYDLAKELKIDTKRLIEDVRREGVDVSIPSNSISKELAENIRDKYLPKGTTVPKRAVKVVKKAARPVVEEARCQLKLCLKYHQSQRRVLDGNIKGLEGGQKLLFDETIGPSRERQTASPDIVFQRATPGVDGSYATLLVAEVKYKDFIEPRREEINQASAYALSYRAPVVIVHTRGEGKPHGMYPFRRYEDPYRFYHYAFDLAATDPEAEEEMFAKSIRGLLHV